MVQNSCIKMCTSNSVRVISIAKPVKKGFLRRYKKRFIGNNWRKEWIVLHEDSSLEWYKDEEENDIEGGTCLKDAPEMIAAGPFANYVPGKPELPKGGDLNCLMAFGNKTKDVINWFLASNLDDLNQWMTAISNTLPPPPKQPDAANGNNQNGGVTRQGGDMPPPYAPPAPSAPNPPQQGNMNQQRPMPQGNPQGQFGGGGYGGNGGGFGGRGGYGGGGGQNTVIIERDNNGLGNFAGGMMMGAALSGWGCGYGWGLGPSIGFGGWGLGYGFGGPRLGGYSDTDINITNNYNTTNSTVNNGPEANGNNDAAAVDAPAPDAGNDAAANEVAAPEIDNDPGLDSGVDTNGFQPGFEPDAEMVPDASYDDGQMYDGGGMDMGGGGDFYPDDNYDNYNTGGDFDTGQSYDMGGFDMGGFDMGGMDFEY